MRCQPLRGRFAELVAGRHEGQPLPRGQPLRGRLLVVEHRYERARCAGRLRIIDTGPATITPNPRWSRRDHIADNAKVAGSEVRSSPPMATRPSPAAGPIGSNGTA